jgi:hypothetical protein
MAVIRMHLAKKGLGLFNDLQNEHSIVGNFPDMWVWGSNSFLVCNCLVIYSSRQSPSSFKDLYRAITNSPSPRLMVKEFGTQGMILVLSDLDLVLTRNRAEKRVHPRKT